MLASYEHDIDHLMFVIYAHRHPGVRPHAIAESYYRTAAIAALKALGIIPPHAIDTLTVAIDGMLEAQ